MRRLTAIALAALAAASATAATGCGGDSAPRPSGEAAALRQAARTHEYPSPATAADAVTGGWPSAVSAVEAFATAYINWSFATVTAQMRALAQASVGQARAATALAAAETAGDYELHHGGISNHGTVEAIAPLAHHPDQYVVVTREQTTATDSAAYQGLRPAWHLALATVTRLAGGQWVVSGWEPQS